MRPLGMKMQLKDLSKPVTSKRLNESLSKKFGYKLNLGKFSDAQLEDARNKLRTRLSQFEVNESYEAVLENTGYQKTRMFLDVVNQEILEREMTSAEKVKEKDIKKKTDPSGMKASMKKQYGKDKGESVYFATIRKRAMNHSVPESWINSAIKRIRLGESDKDELRAELAVRYDLNESQANWILLENEEKKAEIILATKDMIDRVTNWLDDIASTKGEQILELLDSIRVNMGNDVAERYSKIIRPALENVYSTLENTRTSLNSGLSIVTGEEPVTMGAEPETVGPGIAAGGGAPAGPAMPPAPGGPEAPIGGGAPELPPTEPVAGSEREKRESIEYSRRLGILLNSKKK